MQVERYMCFKNIGFVCREESIEKLYYNIERKVNVVVYFLAKILSRVSICMSTVHILCQITWGAPFTSNLDM
jgi:hypothetical protein